MHPQIEQTKNTSLWGTLESLEYPIHIQILFLLYKIIR